MARSSFMHRLLCFVFAAALAVIGVALATPAQAAGTTRYVAPNGDDSANDCTDPSDPCQHIVYAVGQADSGDTISIAAGTYHESVRIRKSLTLIGAGSTGSGKSTIDGNDDNASIWVDGTDNNIRPEVTVQDLNVSGNTANDGIFVELAIVHVIDSVVSDNDGTGLNVDGSTATVQTSTISGNSDSGVYLGESSTVEITDSTLDSNVFYGIQVEGFSDQLTLTSSTVSNTVPGETRVGQGYGCGVCVFSGGDALIQRSTIFGNYGQGVLWFNGGQVELVNSTVSGTQAQGTVGGILNVPYAGVVQFVQVAQKSGHGAGRAAAARQDGNGVFLRNTIVADNTTLPDCDGTIDDESYNLDSDGTCSWTQGTSITKGNAKLGPLANNGGPTLTLLPAKGSDAIDEIPSAIAGCSPKIPDQRGVSRPQGPKCDIGAVEADQPPIVISPNKLPHGTVGVHYHQQLTATGGLGEPYEFSLAPNSDPLPDGLTLHPSGKISGTPTKAGRFPITVSVDDPTLKDYVIVIEAPVTATPTTPVVTPPETGPIANTGANVAPLSVTGAVAIVAGLLFLLAAGWIGSRPGRHRPGRAH